jgi:D-methionine transport system substrate-binding protein
MKRSNGKKLKLVIFSLALVMLSMTFLAGCGEKEDEKAAEKEEIVVNVASRNELPEIYDVLNEELKAEGIRVVNTAYDTSVNLNELLLEGDIDMNVAQHYAYLNFAKENDSKFDDLTAIGQIHIATLDLYSKKFDNVEDLPDGALIAIPNDAMNGGRALLTLDRAGVITLDDNWTSFPDPTNIKENPKNIELLDIASDSMVITLEDVDAGFVYSLNAVEGGYDPVADPIFNDTLDFKNNPKQRDFIIVFTARVEDEDNEAFQKVIKAYHSDAVYQVYKDVYKGSMIPVNDDEAVDLSKY